MRLLALCRFIDKYGTHVVVGVKMGGKDVVCVKQLKGSSLTQSDVQARLKKLADGKFSQDGPAGNPTAAGDDRLTHGLNVSVLCSACTSAHSVTVT